jgi:alpha/beta superfamily hydrolase
LHLIQQGGNPLSQQVIAPGADHYFTGSSDQLIENISVWLDGLTL